MGDVKAGFLLGEVARLTGVDQRTLDFWDRSDFINPSVQRATGKGSQRLWSFDDLVAIRVAGQLRQAGISLQALRRVVEFLRASGVDQPLAATYLASNGHDVFQVHGDAVISTLRQPGQGGFLWLVDVGAVVEELRAAIAA